MKVDTSEENPKRILLQEKITNFFSRAETTKHHSDRGRNCVGGPDNYLLIGCIHKPQAYWQMCCLISCHS